MKIGILTRRRTGLVKDLKAVLEQMEYVVRIYSYDNLHIDESLFNNDFYILKSKKELFLNAAFYIKAHGIPIFPDPDICYSHRNRVKAHQLIRTYGLKCPNIYVGILGMLQKKLRPKDFPLVQKKIMGSESKGVFVVNSLQEVKSQDPIIYLEEYIEGTHFNVHFIEDEIEVFLKKPFDPEIVKRTELTEDIEDLIRRWKSNHETKLRFGHLDIIREKDSNELYIVDVGTFPQFSHWEPSKKPLKKLVAIILNEIE